MLGTIVRIAQIGFLVVATGVLGWFLWGKLKSEPRRELQPFRRTLAEQACEAIARDLPRRDEIRKLAVLPVVGDLDRRVFDMLCEAVEDAGRYDFLVGESTVLELIDEQRDGREPMSRKEAVEIGRALAEKDSAVQGVLFARLPDFTEGRRGLGAKVTLDASLVELKTGLVVPGGVVSATHQVESRASLDYFAPFMETQSKLLRLFFFVLAVAGLPFALLPVARSVLRGRNTQHNVVLVASMTAFALVLATGLMGFRPGWFGLVVVLLGTLGALIYNWEILEKIEAMG